MPPIPPNPSSRALLLPALLIAALTFGAYLPAARGEFLWDDDLYAANPILQETGSLLKIWTLGDFPDRFYYKNYPVTYSVFWLGRRLWGENPFGFHLLNILLHAVNACLVWLLLRRLGLRWAWLAGAVFALHPVHVESVAWISELKNVLSGLFFLLAVGAYQLFEERGSRRWYAAALALFALALLSKAVAVTLPPALLLLRWAKGLKTGRAQLAVLTPFFVLSAAMGVFTLSLEFDPRDAEIGLAGIRRALTAARALWFYPMKLLFPVNLAFSYERWGLDPRSAAAWAWPLATALAAAVLWRLRGGLGRGFFAGLGFYALNIFPLLGFVGIYTFRYSFVADHYQYLASVGLIALAAAALARAAGPARRLQWLCGLILLPLLAGATWRRSAVYRTQEGLWRDTLRKNPSSSLALVNLGADLKGEAAVRYWEPVLAEHPGLYEAHCNLAVALGALGRSEAALEHFYAALKLNPDFTKAHEQAARLLASLGRMGEALGHYRELVKLAPGYASARNEYGLALLAMGSEQEALVHLQKAVALRPDRAEIHNNIGLAFYALGRPADAARAFREALRLDPGLPQARRNMAMALSALERAPRRQAGGARLF